MRLTDIMSGLELVEYAEVALVLFMAVFAAVTVRVFARKNHQEWERARYMPLDRSEERS